VRQRSLQKGRQRLAGVKGAGRWQVGQGTLRSPGVAMAGADALRRRG
jgi:hypothetical protein